MKLYQRIQTLSAAALLAATIAGASVGHADAKPKDDNGVRCSIPGSMIVYGGAHLNDWEFFMPGDSVIVYDSNGELRHIKCMPDGTWRVIGRSPSIASPIRPNLPPLVQTGP